MESVPEDFFSTQACYCARAYPEPDAPAVEKLRSSPGAGAKAPPPGAVGGVITKFSVMPGLLAVVAAAVDDLLIVMVPEQSESTE